MVLRPILCSCLLLSLTGATWAQSEEHPDDRIVQAIRLIKDAMDAKAAAEAYTKGCTADRDSLDLNRAYMGKLLRINEPVLADVPARRLTLKDKTDGLAWAVAGYNDAKKNHLEKALSELLQAQSLREDPATLNNLAQLAAWYKFCTAHNKIPVADEGKLDTLVSQSKEIEAFSREYDRVAAEYKKKAEFDDKLNGENAKLAAARTNVQDLQRQWDTLNKEIRNQEWRARDSQQNPDKYPGGRVQGPSRESYRERDQLKRQVQEAQTEVERQTKAVNDVKKEAPAAIVLPRLLRWQPPTVDLPESEPASKPASKPAE